MPENRDPDPRAVLRVEGLTKRYDLGATVVHALRGVDLELYEGELLVLLGPSGSGKSTLLNIVGGLDVPSDGRLWYGDEELTGADADRLTEYRRDHVGFVFQFYNLIPSLTAAENVRLVCDIARDPMDVAAALELVGLSDRADHFPAQLSGGEQQRVAIARAIAKQPELLLCDEPTGALDVATGVRVLEALGHVNRVLGATTAIITHNEAIAAMADRVVRFRDGAIADVVEQSAPRSPREIAW